MKQQTPLPLPPYSSLFENKEARKQTNIDALPLEHKGAAGTKVRLAALRRRKDPTWAGGQVLGVLLAQSVFFEKGE